MILLLALLPVFATAQSVLLGPLAAASRAAGGTGVTSRGLRSLWHNPAGLADRRAFAAGASVEQRFGIAELGIASGGATFRSFGLQVASLGLDDYAEQRLGLSYGRSLSDRLRVGAQFGVLHRVVRGVSARTQGVAGVGGQYRLSGVLDVGATFLTAIGSKEATYLTGGVGYAPNARVRLAAEVVHRPDRPVGTRFGLRYAPHPDVAVYLGAAPVDRSVTFGCGYRVAAGLRITAAVAMHERLGLSPGIGLAYRAGVGAERNQRE